MAIHGMPGLPAGGFDLVFSFDTTGSMSRVIDEVKGRISDMIQRLQSDIPSIRIGVIAHGDYCDEAVFYLEKHIDLSSDIVQLTEFVKDVDGTGGGDPEECYEYVLKLAQGLSWTPGSQRALVVIGDSIPHEPDYDLNVDNLDWRTEAKRLAEMGIKIYGVQAFEEESSAAFFQELVILTSGEHLKLSQFSHICDFIMAICYRERGAEYLEDYEAEVRAREARVGLHKDLEEMFGALRRGDSNASSKPGTLSRTTSKAAEDFVLKVPALSPITSTSAAGSSDTPRSPSPAPSASTSGCTYTSSESMDELIDAVAKGRTTCLAARTTKRNVKTHTVNLKTEPLVQSNTMKTKRNVLKTSRTTKVSENKKQVPKYRHLVPGSKFVLGKRSVAWRWNNWKLVMVPNLIGRALDQTLVPRGKAGVPGAKLGFRKRELFPCDTVGQRALYEVAVQKATRKHLKKNVMFSKACTITDWSNWENKLLGNKFVQRQINAVLKNGGYVWVRRFMLKGMGKRQNELVNKYSDRNMYLYAWDCRTQLKAPGKLSWAMDTD